MLLGRKRRPLQYSMGGRGRGKSGAGGRRYGPPPTRKASEDRWGCRFQSGCEEGKGGLCHDSRRDVILLPLQTALANRAVLQGNQAKPPSENFRGHFSQRGQNPDLDSIDRDFADQVSSVQEPDVVGTLKSGRITALEPVYTQESVEMGR